MWSSSHPAGVSAPLPHALLLLFLHPSHVSFLKIPASALTRQGQVPFPGFAHSTLLSCSAQEPNPNPYHSTNTSHRLQQVFENLGSQEVLSNGKDKSSEFFLLCLFSLAQGLNSLTKRKIKTWSHPSAFPHLLSFAISLVGKMWLVGNCPLNAFKRKHACCALLHCYYPFG